MTSLRRLEELRADARYHRERRDLYRAKAYGPRPTSPARLRELERTSVLSEARLRRAEQEHDAETGRDPGATPEPRMRRRLNKSPTASS
jgi:hypothetical protein